MPFDSLYPLVVFELLIFVAYFLKGFSGFGPALVFIPTVSYMFSPQSALAASAFIDIFVGLYMLSTFKYSRSDVKMIVWISGFMGIGTIAGASMVGWLSSEVLFVLICSSVFLFGINMIVLKQPLPTRIEPHESKMLWGYSILGGLTGGLVGISGPFVVVAAKKLLNKNSFRKVMVAVFIAEGIIKLIAYYILGVWTEDVLPISLYATVMVMVGLWVGYKAHEVVSEKNFSRAIGIILVLISVNAYLAG